MGNSINETLRHQEFPPSALYVVSTPIGNMADITYRAAYILANVDGIACEDTRHTLHLLNYLGIQKPLMAIHEHNEISASKNLLELITKGERWAYVSDAGTPGISDPGAKLVNIMHLAGKKVVPIPGVSAVSTALSVSGITTMHSNGNFQFLGFLPTKGRERKLQLEKIFNSPLATIFFESPQRIQETLSEIGSILKNEMRHVMVGRELTKKFESIDFLMASDIEAWLQSSPSLKGEFCIIVEGINSSKEIKEGDDHLINPMRLASVLSEYMGSKQIAEILSKCDLMSKNQAYQLALEIKKAQQ